MQTLTEQAFPLIVAPADLTAAQLRIEATGFSMFASRTGSLDLREYMTAKSRVYRAAAAALEAVSA